MPKELFFFWFMGTIVFLQQNNNIYNTDEATTPSNDNKPIY